MANEPTWAPCLGWPGYEASSDGRIRSCDRIITKGNGVSIRRRGRVLKPWNTRGYQAVSLSGVGCGRKTYVHTLVCEAFHGPRSGSEEVRHLNGNRQDNRAENLTWGTSSENNQDIVRHGRHYQAKKRQCPRGHPYDTVRTRRDGGIERRCSICSAESLKRARRNAKAKDGWETVACPKCQSVPGQRCRSVRGLNVDAHRARHILAQSTNPIRITAASRSHE